MKPFVAFVPSTITVEDLKGPPAGEMKFCALCGSSGHRANSCKWLRRGIAGSRGRTVHHHRPAEGFGCRMSDEKDILRRMVVARRDCVRDQLMHVQFELTHDDFADFRSHKDFHAFGNIIIQRDEAEYFALGVRVVERDCASSSLLQSNGSSRDLA